jgi:hypothetical protein
VKRTDAAAENWSRFLAEATAKALEGIALAAPLPKENAGGGDRPCPERSKKV